MGISWVDKRAPFTTHLLLYCLILSFLFTSACLYSYFLPDFLSWFFNFALLESHSTTLIYSRHEYLCRRARLIRRLWLDFGTGQRLVTPRFLKKNRSYGVYCFENLVMLVCYWCFLCHHHSIIVLSGFPFSNSQCFVQIYDCVTYRNIRPTLLAFIQPTLIARLWLILAFQLWLISFITVLLSFAISFRFPFLFLFLSGFFQSKFLLLTDKVVSRFTPCWLTATATALGLSGSQSLTETRWYGLVKLGSVSTDRHTLEGIFIVHSVFIRDFPSLALIFSSWCFPKFESFFLRLTLCLLERTFLLCWFFPT